MLSGLKELIPGAEHWPAFKRNISEQFEAASPLVSRAEHDGVLGCPVC
jgi:phosphoribosylformylglycinamidine synthase